MEGGKGEGGRKRRETESCVASRVEAGFLCSPVIFPSFLSPLPVMGAETRRPLPPRVLAVPVQGEEMCAFSRLQKRGLEESPRQGLEEQASVLPGGRRCPL